jgi:hypothetical protein
VTGRPCLCALLLLSASVARAEASQPYIDQLKRELKENDAAAPTGGSYTEELKKKLGAEPGGSDGAGYTESLKRAMDAKESSAPGSYTEEQKQKLGPAPRGSAIQDYKEGKQLQARMEGEVRHAGGLRFGASLTQDITGGRRNFQDVYNSLTLPGVGAWYEYQPFRNDWLGNLGLVASVNASLNRGRGVFETDIGFGTQARTKLSFITLPVMVGASYRFSLLRFIRPYVMAGPTAVGYFELRDDDRDTQWGYSRAVTLSGGVDILLDWIDRRSMWERYETGGIKHTWLTVDYTRISTFSGDVDFSLAGLNLGLTFEF